MKTIVHSIFLILGIAMVSGLSAIGFSQSETDLPKVARDVGVDPRLGDSVDLTLAFYDTDNNVIRLSDLFDGKRPIVLSFNYSNCPKLCSVQLENMTLELRELDLSVGKDFEIISVTFDPNEQLARLRDTRAKYVGLYNREGSESGWHFLKSSRGSVDELARQCGVRYKYVADQKLYSHPPVFLLLSPEGKIVRYIYGLSYDSATIKGALIEAASGKIGSPINYLAYATGCYVYDASTGKYTGAAMAIMRIAGIATILALLAGILPYLYVRHRGANRQSAPPANKQDGYRGRQTTSNNVSTGDVS